jgi:hypothetical protein
MLILLVSNFMSRSKNVYPNSECFLKLLFSNADFIYDQKCELS